MPTLLLDQALVVLGTTDLSEQREVSSVLRVLANNACVYVNSGLLLRAELRGFKHREVTYLVATFLIFLHRLL
jgi:hypothetical protein